MDESFSIAISAREPAGRCSVHFIGHVAEIGRQHGIVDHHVDAFGQCRKIGMGHVECHCLRARGLDQSLLRRIGIARHGKDLVVLRQFHRNRQGDKPAGAGDEHTLA